MPADPIDGPALRILVVDDAAAEARSIGEALCGAAAPGSVRIDFADSIAAAEERLRSAAYHCVLLDLELPDGVGMDNVHRVRSARPGQVVVAMAAADGEEAAVRALQRGAQDYLIKGRCAGPLVLRLVRRAIERSRALGDVDQLREYQYYLATHDVVTGLPNRHLFVDRAAGALRRAQHGRQALAIASLQLEGFQAVRGTHGEAVSDALLRTVAHGFLDGLRATDAIARTGGGDFLLLLAPLAPETADAEIRAALDRLRARVADVRRIEGREVRIALAATMARFPHHGETLEELLRVTGRGSRDRNRRTRGGTVGEGSVPVPVEGGH